MKPNKLFQPLTPLLYPCFLLGLLAIAGCGKSGEADNSLDRNSDQEPQIVQRTESNPSTSELPATVEVLRDLTLTARKYEGEHRFVDAANVWAEVIQKLEQEFGAGAWQAANAKLARETAIQQNSFNPPQLAILDEVTDLQKQVRAANEQNETTVAASLAARSLQKTIQLFGEEAVVTAKQRRLLAQLLLQTGNTNRAVFELEQALKVLQAYYQKAHPEVVTLHDQLGEILSEISQSDKAIDQLSAATRLAGEVWGDDSTQYAKRANQLGVAYYRSGELTTAVDILRAAEVIRARSLGTDSLEVAHSRHNIGTAFLELRNNEAAIQYLKAAYDTFAANNLVNIRHQVSGKLSTAYMLANQPDLAEPLLAEQCGFVQQLHSKNPEHADVADAKYRYAIALGRQGKYQMAEPEIRMALALNEKLFGPNHSRTRNCYQAYTMLLERTNRPELANRLKEQLRTAQQSSTDNTFVR